MNIIHKILKTINYKLVNWQMSKKHSIVFGKPYFLALDTTNLCNLECVWCPTGQKRNTRTLATMAKEKVFEIFDKFGPYLKEILLFNWGEPFLNKDIIEIMSYAKKKYSLYLVISSNMNVRLSYEDACKIVDSGLDKFIASIDGVTQKSYEIYRKKGSISLALDNLKILTKAKRDKKSKTPEIVWQYLVFKHNEHEIEDAKKLADEIGVDRLEFSKPWCPTDWASTIEQYSNYTANKSDKEYKQKEDYCNWLWNSIVINSNGSVSPCCSVEDEKEDFGNIFGQVFLKLYNNKEFRTARLYNKNRKDGGHMNRCTVCEHIGTCNHKCN
ncbi:MAG: radical SAM protein [Endomicrobiaceae bacterium]|nr:radical SAM protein [Endomicrobiaceae bacterium]